MKRKAVFLDRDGVINVERSFVVKPGEMELYPFSAKAIKKINESGYLAIVITNQSAIARNLITIGELEEIHQDLQNKLKAGGAYVDAIYYCPHREIVDHEVRDNAYIRDCDCRKPKPGLLLKAAEDFNINLEDSYFIGDAERDIVAGKRSHCKTIGVKTGYALKDTEVEPDYIFDNLQQAVDYIVDQESPIHSGRKFPL